MFARPACNEADLRENAMNELSKIAMQNITAQDMDREEQVTYPV